MPHRNQGGIREVPVAQRRVEMRKVKLTVVVTVLAASVLTTAAFASTKTSTDPCAARAKGLAFRPYAL
jgi:hypothetical protein